MEFNNVKTVIESVRKVKNGAYQIRVKDSLIRRDNSSALQLLNEGDMRFFRTIYGWAKATPESLNRHFGVSLQELESLNDNDVMELNIANPQMDGADLRVLLIETTEPTEYEKDNILNRTKQIKVTRFILDNKNPNFLKSNNLVLDEQGYFVDEENNPIFAHTSIVLCEKNTEPTHVFIKGMLVTEEEAFGIVVEKINKEVKEAF